MFCVSKVYVYWCEMGCKWLTSFNKILVLTFNLHLYLLLPWRKHCELKYDHSHTLGWSKLLTIPTNPSKMLLIDLWTMHSTKIISGNQPRRLLLSNKVFWPDMKRKSHKIKLEMVKIELVTKKRLNITIIIINTGLSRVETHSHPHPPTNCHSHPWMWSFLHHTSLLYVLFVVYYVL